MSKHEAEAVARRSCESQATRVTFFEDRAEVQRRARVTVPAGLSSVEISGVSAVLDDPSLVAGVRGEGARVLSARVLRQVLVAAALTGPELLAAEEAAQAARLAREKIEQTLQRARTEIGRIDALFGAWLRAVGGVPRGGTAAVARWRTAYGSIDDARGAALDRIHRALAALHKAREEEARAELELREGRREEPRQRTVLIVQVQRSMDDGGAELELELSYRVPCALWRPEHLANLGENNDRRPELTLTTYAVAWQATGEVWRDVECRFSTARPAQSASPPLLSDDWLTLRRKSDAEQRTVVVEAREQAISVAGLQGKGAVDEMPGVEDGGEPLWFAPLSGQRASFPSDGRPVRLPIAEAKLPAQVDLVAYPERGPGAHLKATATLSGSASPILAGPVRLLRGGALAGQGRLLFVGRGEPFALGFGVDDGLRLRRTIDETRDQTAVIGTQKVQRTVKLFLSNLSGAPRRLQVTERIPVSEIEEVRVNLTNPGGGRLVGVNGDPAGAADGFLRFDVDLPAGATRELSYVYRIEAAAKVVLPF